MAGYSKSKKLTIGSSDSASLGWHMLSRKEELPKLKTSFVDVPGRSGSYDFSLVGGAKYEDRSVGYVFATKARGYQQSAAKAKSFIAFLRTALGGSFHDTITDEFGLSFQGASITSIESDICENMAKVSVTFRCRPHLKNASGGDEL